MVRSAVKVHLRTRPTEPKIRRIRKGNPQVQAQLLSLPVALLSLPVARQAVVGRQAEVGPQAEVARLPARLRRSL